MLERTIKYTDFFGNKREEPFFFNLNKSEVQKLNFSYKGGFAEYIRRAARHEDGETLTKLFEKLILMSYGEISEDGKSFVKDPAATKRFLESNAYDELYMEFMTKEGAFAAFMNSVVPHSDEAEDVDVVEAGPTLIQ